LAPHQVVDSVGRLLWLKSPGRGSMILAASLPRLNGNALTPGMRRHEGFTAFGSPA